MRRKKNERKEGGGGGEEREKERGILERTVSVCSVGTREGPSDLISYAFSPFKN